LEKSHDYVAHPAKTHYLDIKLHAYDIRPRKDKRGFDLISDALPFGRL
jgi:hypothetical protein